MHEHFHNQGRNAALLQGLGHGAAGGLQSRLAAKRRRLGGADVPPRFEWFSLHRSRPARPWSLESAMEREPHGSVRGRPRRADGGARTSERTHGRPLDRWRRSRALHRPARHQARRQGGTDGRSAADHGQDGGLSRRPVDGGVRRLSEGLPRRPIAILSRGRKRSLLQFQPSRREAVPGNGECLVATGNDVRPQERLRLHQGVLGN